MAQKIKNKVNKQSINHYSESFKLLRRFRNFLRKDLVSFQQIRLLYMAFSKAAIEKKLDTDSKYYELYKQANEAVVKMYQKADEKKEEYKDSGFNIVDTESNIYKKVDELISSKQIDIGVRLTKRFVNMINTKPDKAKAKRLLTSIDNAIENKQLMTDNRLYQQVIHAKEELQDYLDTGDALEVVDYVGNKKGQKSDKKENSKSNNRGNLITDSDISYLNQIKTFVEENQSKYNIETQKDFTEKVVEILKQRVKERSGKVKERFERLLDKVETDLKSNRYLTFNKKEKSANEKLKDDILATAKKYGITPKGMSAPTSKKSYVLQNLEDELGIDLDLWDAGDHLVLSKIAVPKNKRGSGVGSKAMQKIINFADAQGKDIRLTPSKDFGASSVSRLKKFYKKYGFVNKPKSDFSSKETMIRYAQGMSAPTYNGHQVLQAHEIGMMAPAEIVPGMNGSKSVEQAVNNLILNKIKTGKKLPPWKKSWASQSNQKAKNYFSEIIFSGSNSLILNGLLASVMKTPYYGTWNQIENAGGKIKDTKDYIPIIYYNFTYRLKQFGDNADKKNNLLSKIKGQKIRKKIKGKFKDITLNEKNYYKIYFNENQINKFINSGVTKDEYYKNGFVKYYRVYNLSNTTGIDYKLPEPKQLNKGQRIANAEALLESFRDKPPIKEDTKQAYYIPKKDEVYIPKITQFESEEEYYSTLFHELIHSTMHKSRLDREKDYKGKKEGASRAFEELIAELGASFLCGEVGILNVVHLNSAAYLKNWHKKLQEQTGKYEDFFIYATREAKKAADYILKNYEPAKTTKSNNQSTDKEKAKAKARARARARKRKRERQKQS